MNIQVNNLSNGTQSFTTTFNGKKTKIAQSKYDKRFGFEVECAGPLGKDYRNGLGHERQDVETFIENRVTSMLDIDAVKFEYGQ